MTINRRAIVTGSAALLSPIVVCANNTTEALGAAPAAHGDAERLAFLRNAVANIKTEAEQIRINRERLSESKDAGALFSQLPALFPFRDWDYFYIDRELKWSPPPGARFATVRVPRGFVTDLASIPRIFWSIFPPTGPYTWAAIVHDFLYWTQTGPREDADEIMALGMKELGASDVSIKAFHASLRVAGGFAWDKNKQLRAAGESRVLRTFPTSVEVRWSDWKSKPEVFRRG